MLGCHFGSIRLLTSPKTRLQKSRIFELQAKQNGTISFTSSTTRVACTIGCDLRGVKQRSIGQELLSQVQITSSLRLRKSVLAHIVSACTHCDMFMPMSEETSGHLPSMLSHPPRLSESDIGTCNGLLPWLNSQIWSINKGFESLSAAIALQKKEEIKRMDITGQCLQGFKLSFNFCRIRSRPTVLPGFYLIIPLQSLDQPQGESETSKLFEPALIGPSDLVEPGFLFLCIERPPKSRENK